jgi:hypothetical protein
LAQASPNGLTDQQSARQYGYSRRNPGNDWEIGAPVVNEIAKYQSALIHNSVRFILRSWFRNPKSKDH